MEISEQIGDVKDKATTLKNMALVFFQQEVMKPLMPKVQEALATIQAGDVVTIRLPDAIA